MTRPVVVVVAGTRPEALKVGPVVAALRRDSRVRVLYLWTGQHRDESMRPWEAAPTWGAPDVDAASTSTDDLVMADDLCAALVRELRADDAPVPSAFVVQGDTRSALAGARLAYAFRDSGAVLVHLEAGLRCWDDRVPEERIRREIDGLADLLLAPSELAAAFARVDASPRATVRVVGQTGLDALCEARRQGSEPGLPFVRSLGLRPGERWALLTLHRAELTDAHVAQAAHRVVRAARSADVRVVWPVHPRHAELVGRSDGDARLLTTGPIPYPTMADLLLRFPGDDWTWRPSAVVTDSGGLVEDADFAGLPVAVYRETTERWECLNRGSVLVRPSWSDDDATSTIARVLRPPSNPRRENTTPYGWPSRSPRSTTRPTALVVEEVVSAALHPERYLR